MTALASWALLLPTVALAASAKLDQAPVPAHREPYHKLVFQNELVRVLDVRVPAGRVTQYHVHADPLVTVATEDAPTRVQLLGAEPGPESPGAAVPYASDNWDQERPYTHRVRNIGVTPFRRIGAEWLAPAAANCTDLPLPPGYRLIREGRFGRVYELHLEVGQSTPPHTHSCPGLTVQGTGGLLHSRGSQVVAQNGAGSGHWSWRNAGHRHSLHNSGDQKIILYEIDWR